MCTHLQVVVLYKLVEWFPFSRLPSHIYSAIVGYNIWNVSWKICFQVRNEICSLQGVVFHASSHEVWNPKLPMPDDMWTIFPTYSHSKIRVKKGHVYKGIVKMVYWILGWFRVESLCNYCLCCGLKPLLSDVMVDFIIWWFQLQVAAYASNQMCSKDMGDKFVSYIKHLHSLVNLFAVDVFSDVTEWPRQTWITPEDEENHPETFPEEMKVPYKVLAVT